jgi:peptidoglycan/LPS O-acetylase OafA/YrhL
MTKNALPEPNDSIWYWRTGAWIYSVFALLAIFHLPTRIGYPATLSVFSFYCYFWLQRELQRWRIRPPWRWTESGGAWSYSMYLVHMSVITAFGEWQLPVPVLVNWALKFAAVLLTSYIFSVLIESPSHSAARRWGRSIGRPRAVPATGY